jgi:hypothetical protein
VLRHGLRHLQFDSVHIGWRPYIRLQSVFSVRSVTTLLRQVQYCNVNSIEVLNCKRRVTDRQTGRPNGRVSGQVVVVTGRLFTGKAGQTTWELWWSAFDCDGFLFQYINCSLSVSLHNIPAIIHCNVITTVKCAGKLHMALDL